MTTSTKPKTAKKSTKSTVKTVAKSENIITDTQAAVSGMDEYLFHAGKHFSAYKFMGAHAVIENGQSGIRFTTWAPNAGKVCVIGDFCHWHELDENCMQRINYGGIWTIFIPNIADGSKYKFAVTNQWSNYMTYKNDPYAISSELRPNTASVININTEYEWNDQKWLENRTQYDINRCPMNIYELHLASWRTKDGGFLSYAELSETLPNYIKEMGYTHIELMPLHEHPLDASWGYQSTGYFSATSRHGDLRGLKLLVDKLHQAGIGVILDWVAGHFGKDEQGLINFDGSACYEYQDYWRANNKAWGAHNFDLGRNEVKCFLISNAMYWVNEFHIDGLRVDAVSNILYLSYDRNDGEWQPNIYGGNENLEAIDFLKEFNYEMKHTFPGVVTIAEESTAWPKITVPVEYGGLGFDLKWNMGWMNDTLRYIKLDPVYRKYHHNQINFSMLYHYSEKFVLAISHDEVVHGKGALIDKMWGDNWNKYSGLRLYATYMIGHPGKKLLFMGSEFGQFVEWHEYESLQWHIIEQYHTHRETQNFFKKLNHLYLEHKSLWECDYDHEGFQWIDADNAEQSIISFIRYSKDKHECLLFVLNFTPMVYFDYAIGVPEAGTYQEIFNSDGLEFGGSGQVMDTILNSVDEYSHNRPHKISMKIPPMAAVVFKLIK